MQKHDDDNIPVLEDIIHEHDNLQPDAPVTNEKQKTLWDDDDFAETPAAAATLDAYADEYTWDEPVVTFDDDGPAGEMVDDTNAFQNEEPVALLRHEEPVETIDVVEATTDDDDANVDVINADPEESTYAESIHAAPLPVDDALSPRAEQIDIDELAQRILRRLIPDLEDYLSERIRDALETALDDKTHD
jgi:hypothetical protein